MRKLGSRLDSTVFGLMFLSVLFVLRVECSSQSERGKDQGVVIGEEVVVAAAPPEEKRWGFFQSPRFEDPLSDGSLVINFDVAVDEVEGLTILHPEKYNSKEGTRSWKLGENHERGSGIIRYMSKNEGKTWSLYSGPSSGMLLSNGDRLRIKMPSAFYSSKAHMPEPVGKISGKVLYRVRELPLAFQGAYFIRIPRGENQQYDEHNVVNDPLALRYVEDNFLVHFWLGDMRLLSDGSLLAGIETGNLEGNDLFPKHVFFYRSTDYGKNWDIQGRILYQMLPSDADPLVNGMEGFSEPSFVQLRDSSLVCVMRLDRNRKKKGDFSRQGPLHLSRSFDGGKSWSQPQPISKRGVSPELLLLNNGTLVLAAGRPGMELYLSDDGRGEQWTEPTNLVEMRNDELNDHGDSIRYNSSGYPALWPLSDSSFLLAYSRTNWKDQEGKERKVIVVRKIQVKR